jgi:hypothetical protein
MDVVKYRLFGSVDGHVFCNRNIEYLLMDFLNILEILQYIS